MDCVLQEKVTKRNQAAVYCFQERRRYGVMFLLAQDACGFACVMTLLQQKEWRVIPAPIPSTIGAFLWEVGDAAPPLWERLFTSRLLCKQWMKRRLKAAARELCLLLPSMWSFCVGYSHKLNTGSSPVGSMGLPDFTPREVQVGDAELSKMVF